MSKEISDQIAKASEVYAQNTALRAIINLIPVIGGSLDVIFSSKGQAIMEKRLMDFFKDLHAEMNLVREEMIDKKFMESEEFFDILLKAIDAAVKTRSRDKIHLYAKLLRGAITTQDRSEFSPEDYLSSLIELTPKEIEVALAIYKQQGNDSPQSNESILQWAWRKGWKDLPKYCHSVNEKDLEFILLRLEKSGFIHELTGSYIGYDGGVYVITDAFKKLMKYIG